MIRLLTLFIGSMVCFSFSLDASASSGEPIAGLPFQRFHVQDNLGRTVTYYRTFSAGKKLPLAVFIQGSGCTSVFLKRPDGNISGGYQNVLLGVSKDQWNVMVVEKPEVNFLDNNSKPGQAVECTEKFNAEHTLDRWAEALNSALSDAIKANDVDSKKILVIGHSEGAISAAKLASMNGKVTHVSLLSGSGSTQLFDFIRQAKTESEVNDIYVQFKKIMQAPNDSMQFAWGHPYKRWASFMTQTSMELLDKTAANIFVAHGTSDPSVPIDSFDALTTDLMRKQRPFEMMRLAGANHSLNGPGEKPPEGMQKAMVHIMNWAASK